jgi:hypothetical protein
MKYGNIFWGIILITIGTLLALRSLDIIFFSWHSIFRLWPLILVFWGIAILPVKGMIKLVLTVLTVVIGIVILSQNPRSDNHWGFWFPDRFTWKHDSNNNDEYENEDYDHEGKWEDQFLSEDYETTDKYARLNMEAVAGEFELMGVTSYLFEFESEGNAGPYNATAEKVNDSTTRVSIEQKEIHRGKNFRNYFKLHLNQNPIWQINIDVGAADIEMDLTPFMVEKVDIDGGACAIELKLGNKYKRTYVNIDAGASGIEIQVPNDAACEVNTSTILSGRELDGFNKISKGLYQTPNFSSSANQIVIDIDAAVSGVKVVRY